MEPDLRLLWRTARRLASAKRRGAERRAHRRSRRQSRESLHRRYPVRFPSRWDLRSCWRCGGSGDRGVAWSRTWSATSPRVVSSAATDARWSTSRKARSSDQASGPARPSRAPRFRDDAGPRRELARLAPARGGGVRQSCSKSTSSRSVERSPTKWAIPTAQARRGGRHVPGIYSAACEVARGRGDGDDGVGDGLRAVR